MSTKRQTGIRAKTVYPGVLFRYGSSQGELRLCSDGSPDICYDILYYDENGKQKMEKVGWKSDGCTPELASEVRVTRLESRKLHKQNKSDKKDVQNGSQKKQVRIRNRTRYPGVFFRFGVDRGREKLCPDGKPDICYDILYREATGKQKMEKAGWRSEGCSPEIAAQIRLERIKSIRPEYGENRALQNRAMGKNVDADLTLDEAWEAYNESWLPNLKGGRDIASRYELYLRPAFGKTLLSDIVGLDIERLKQKLLSDKSLHGHKGLVPGTVRIILSDLRRIFRKVKEWGRYTGPIPYFHLPPSDDKRERFLTPEEAALFLAELQLISCDMFFISKISLYTGMRLNEVLSLREQDINLTAGLIYIDGKTGKRVAYMADDMKEDFAFLLKRGKGQHFLFVNQHGEKLSRSHISSQFKEIVDAMGLNKGKTESKHRLVFHSLRHTFCSWLAMKGVPLLTIGELVGHSTLEMTHRYAKLSPDSKRTALQVIGETLRRS